MHKIIDLVLPPRCVVTGDIVDMPGMLSPQSWKDLHFIEKPFCARCGLPFDFETEEDMICGSCLDSPPSFTQARSALVYNDTSRQLILAFKYGDRLQLVRSFSGWMRRSGQHFLENSHIILPVPLHRKRLWSRRYNQSAIIARDLSKFHENLHYLPHILRRKRATPPQKGLNKKERAQNMRNAFHVKTPNDIAGKNIVLIDDVYTSGATLNACAERLIDAGAQNVFALTLARTVL